MRLVIVTGHNVGVKDDVSFEVRAQLQLTEEERRLIEHYRLHNEVVISKKDWKQMGLDVDVEVTVTKLIKGAVHKCKLRDVSAHIGSMKRFCGEFNSIL